MTNRAITILINVCVFLFAIFWITNAQVKTTVTVTVEDNTVKYLKELVKEREMWIGEDFIEGSNCWVHWLSCDDIKYCVRDAVFCTPE